MADRLLSEFGSLAALLGAHPEARGRAAGDERVAAFLDSAAAVLIHAVAPVELGEPVLSNPQLLIDYLRLRQAHAPVEIVRVLYLNSANRLLKDEVANVGTIDEAQIYIREIIARALALGATALILVHNHPSGEPEASQGDRQITRRLARAAREFGIVLHDHVIVASSGWISLRAEGVI